MLFVGCAQTIPNTTVPDTQENREVIAFMEEFRQAMEERDVRAVLSMTSPDYLDHNGSHLSDDDIDFEDLEERFTTWRDRVMDVRYEIKYQRVTFDFPRVYVDFRYTASFQIADAEGEGHWSRRLRDTRMVLTRDEDSDRFLILSGI